jgi:hypothetical protein
MKGRHDRPLDFVLHSDRLCVNRYVDRTFYGAEKYRRYDQGRVSGRKSRQCQGGAESKHGRVSDSVASPLGNNVTGCRHRDHGAKNQPKQNPAQLPVRETEAFLKLGYQRGPRSKGHPIHKKERRGRPPRSPPLRDWRGDRSRNVGGAARSLFMGKVSWKFDYSSNGHFLCQ